MATPIEDAISQANVGLIRAFNEGTPEDLMCFYTDTSLVLPPGESATQGRQALLARWARMFSPGQRLELVTTTVDQLTQDIALETGLYRKSIPSTEDFSGHYAALWRRVDGEWRIDLDIWNGPLSDPPPPSADTT